MNLLRLSLLFAFAILCVANTICPSSLQVGYSWQGSEVISNGTQVSSINLNLESNQTTLYFWINNASQIYNARLTGYNQAGAVAKVTPNTTHVNTTVGAFHRIMVSTLMVECGEWGLSTITLQYPFDQYSNCIISLQKQCSYSTCGKSTINIGTSRLGNDIVKSGQLNPTWNGSSDATETVYTKNNPTLTFYVWNDDASNVPFLSDSFSTVTVGAANITTHGVELISNHSATSGGLEYAVMVTIACGDSSEPTYFGLTIDIGNTPCDYSWDFTYDCSNGGSGSGLATGTIILIVVVSIVGALLMAFSAYWFHIRPKTRYQSV